MAQGINVIDYATLTVADSAVTLVDDASVTLPDKCKRVFITCRTANVSWRADGTDPTAATDHLLAANDSLSLMNHNYRSVLEKITFIRDTGTSGVLQITYFD